MSFVFVHIFQNHEPSHDTNHKLQQIPNEKSVKLSKNCIGAYLLLGCPPKWDQGTTGDRKVRQPNQRETNTRDPELQNVTVADWR